MDDLGWEDLNYSGLDSAAIVCQRILPVPLRRAGQLALVLFLYTSDSATWGFRPSKTRVAASVSRSGPGPGAFPGPGNMSTYHGSCAPKVRSSCTPETRFRGSLPARPQGVPGSQATAPMNAWV